LKNKSVKFSDIAADLNGIGIYQHEHVKSIPIENHGYKQNSFFRVGLDKTKRALDHVFDDIGRINTIITILFQKTVRNCSLRNLDRKIIT
jgi:hypothetical protein